MNPGGRDMSRIIQIGIEHGIHFVQQASHQWRRDHLPLKPITYLITALSC